MCGKAKVVVQDALEDIDIVELVWSPLRGARGESEQTSRSLCFREAGLSRRIGGRVSGGLLVLIELRIDGGD